MKKISLKDLNLKEVEQLSREELKNVLGGWTGGTTDTTDGSGTACVAAVNCGTSEKPQIIECGCTAGGSCESTSSSVSCKCTGQDESSSSCSD